MEIKRVNTLYVYLYKIFKNCCVIKLRNPEEKKSHILSVTFVRQFMDLGLLHLFAPEVKNNSKADAVISHTLPLSPFFDLLFSYLQLRCAVT
jgi:hypothetical protein